jgi:hypothetical protein
VCGSTHALSADLRTIIALCPDKAHLVCFFRRIGCTVMDLGYFGAFLVDFWIGDGMSAWHGKMERKGRACGSYPRQGMFLRSMMSSKETRNPPFV